MPEFGGGAERDPALRLYQAPTEASSLVPPKLLGAWLPSNPNPEPAQEAECADQIAITAHLA